MAWDGIEQAEVDFRKNDSNLIKALVIWLWICDTTHLILTNRGFWVDIVLSDNGFIVSQEYLDLDFRREILADTHDIRACFRLSACGIHCYKTISISQFYSLQKLLKSIWGVSAVEDTLITLVLFYMLWKQRDGELLGQTSQLLYRVMFIGINTGTWTALVALFALITMTVWPNSMAFVSLNLVISPIYCNTLLANLNARDYIRGARDSYGGTMTGTNTHMTMTPSFRVTQQDGMETLEMDMESQAGSNGATMFDQSSANLKLNNEGIPKTRTM
ncbi:hypothetical protein EYR36_007974 [Pleurotus pulmonarius]|nr:hypothetical protein EYR36_007974 [Pleurotus pulmonarius]